MGMYDSFYFEDGVLPHNKEAENHTFQSKSLDCELDYYVVDKDRKVKKYRLDHLEPECLPIYDAAKVYSHNFDYEPCRYQEYKIIIINSKVVFAEKLKEEGY